MDMVDRMDWLNMAVRMQLSTLDYGWVRVIGSMELMDRGISDHN